MKVSFIVIGQNEGWKLSQNLKAIGRYVEKNNIEHFEIIYVDSNSTDDSLKRALSFDRNIKVLQLTAHCNAAIARNVGAAHANGEWLFFLDGDMEINPEWHSIFLEQTEKGKKFLTGQLVDVYYDNSWHFLTEKPLFGPSKLNVSDVTNGGAFVIDKNLWKAIGGMNPEFDRSQDIDLNYRLASKGHCIYRTEAPYARHHTIQYNFNKHLLPEFKQFRKLMFRGLIMRRHLFNRTVFKRNLRINYSMLLLGPSVIMAVVLHPAIISFYLLVIIFRGSSNFIKFRSAIKKNMVQMILKFIIIDIAATTGFLFYFPGKPNIQYRTVN